MSMAKRIKELESGIVDRREFYNQSAAIYNTAIKIFPQSMLASLLGYKQLLFLDRDNL